MNRATERFTGRIAVVACAVLEDEVRAFAADQTEPPALHFMPQGLHNEPDRLRAELAAVIARLEEEGAADAIALVYGLCSRGLEGLVGRRALLVVPRAHDCITLLLGSKEAYDRYVKTHPATYWYSPGWNKHHLPPGPERTAKLRQEYVEKFGEEDADYLMETEQHWLTTYRRATYVDLGVGDRAKEAGYTRECAKCLGWEYDQVEGDPALLRDLICGRWDEGRFLVLQPGWQVRMTADDRIIEASPNGSRP